jgi:hypothetical protein
MTRISERYSVRWLPVRKRLRVEELEPLIPPNDLFGFAVPWIDVGHVRLVQDSVQQILAPAEFTTSGVGLQRDWSAQDRGRLASLTNDKSSDTGGTSWTPPMPTAAAPVSSINASQLENPLSALSTDNEALTSLFNSNAVLHAVGVSAGTSLPVLQNSAPSNSVSTGSTLAGPATASPASYGALTSSGSNQPSQPDLAKLVPAPHSDSKPIVHFQGPGSGAPTVTNPGN